MNNEFKKITQDNITRYVLESDGGTTSSGSIASNDSAGFKKGLLLTREDNKKTEPPKTRNPVAKNAGAAIGGGAAGAHKDKKKNASVPRKEKHKKPYMEALQARLDQLKSKVAEGSDDAKYKIVCKECGDVFNKPTTDCRHDSHNPNGPNWIKENEGMEEEFNGEYDDEAGMAQSNLLTTARAVMGLLKTIKDRDNLPEWGQEKIAKAEMMLVSVWDYLQSQKAMGNDPQQGVAEGNLNEIKKGAKDSNGFTKCWPGKHAVGTKKGKNGGQVRNCQPNESADSYFESLTNKLAEKLDPNAPVDDWVQDFAQANPEKYHQFRQNNRPGTRKPEKKIERMAQAASYAAKTGK